MQNHIQSPTFGIKSPDDRIKQLMEESERQLKNGPVKGFDTQPLKEDTSLQSNDEFQEMLRDLEVFELQTAPTKYDQAFYSSLRTMMRECIFTKNHLIRKSHIDRVYAWFRKKRSSAPPAVPPPPKPPVTSPRAPMSQEEREMRRERHLARLGVTSRGDPSGADGALSTPADGAERAITDPFDVRGRPASASWAEPRPGASRLGEYKLRNLRVAQLRRRGVPAEDLRAAEAAARRADEARARDARAASVLGDVERAAQELWARKRREEEAARRDDLQVALLRHDDSKHLTESGGITACMIIFMRAAPILSSRSLRRHFTTA
jgi:hypothetical protein